MSQKTLTSLKVLTFLPKLQQKAIRVVPMWPQTQVKLLAFSAVAQADRIRHLQARKQFTDFQGFKIGMSY